MATFRSQPARTQPTSRNFSRADGYNYTMASEPGHTVIPNSSDMSHSGNDFERSSGNTNGTIQKQVIRPSALPRSTSSSSQARLSYIASTRPMPAYAGRSPPLQAMKLAPGVMEGLQIDTLTSLPSSRPTQGGYQQSISTLDTYEDTVLGIAMPEKYSAHHATSLPPRLISELQLHAASSGRQQTAMSSTMSTISSPSTQFTASSSPWSASTTATTPISWSSASPALIQASYNAGKRSNTVPMPSLPKTRIPKMPAVNEAHLRTLTKASPSIEDDSASRRLNTSNQSRQIGSASGSIAPGGRKRTNSTTTSRNQKQSTPQLVTPKIPQQPISASAPAIQTNSRSTDRLPTSTSQGHTRLQEALKDPAQNIMTYQPDLENEKLVLDDPRPQPRQLLEPLPVVKNQHRRLPSLSRRHRRESSASETEPEKQSARSRLAKFSKFALFGKSKSSAPSDSETKRNKLQTTRKGPAAGTGHEGYGKFARRSSKKPSGGSSIAATDSETSITSNSKVRERRPSRMSRVSTTSQEQSDLDDFASSRMKPIPIMGGSQRGRGQPFPLTRQEYMSDSSINTFSSADSYPAQTRLVSPRRERFPPDTDDHPSLAARRSQRFGDSSESFRFPKPIETEDLTSTPCLDSHNTTRSSNLPTPASTMHTIDPSLLEKQRVKSKKLKWNIFRRKESISEGHSNQAKVPSRSGMSVDVAPAPVSRQVPWYALSDSETEINKAVIGQYLKEAAESPEKDAQPDEMISVVWSDDEVMENPYVHRESILLPTPPVREQFSPPQVTQSYFPSLPAPSAALDVSGGDASSRPKQTRLAQVGRIPKVVSTRQQPQGGVSAPSAHPGPRRERLRRQQSREALPRLVTSDQVQTTAQQMPATVQTRPALIRNQVTITAGVPLANENEFLRYAGTRDSDFTTSSESTGVTSLIGPAVGLYNPADDVWNEYDDFMDDIMTPVQSPNKPRTRKRSKTITGTAKIVDIPPMAEKLKDRGLAIGSFDELQARPANNPLSGPRLPLPMLPTVQEPEGYLAEEIRLRRSRIAAALHASYAPSSPFSMRDFIDEYGRRGSAKLSERMSASSAQESPPTVAVVPVSAPPQSTTARQYENAAQLEDIERTRDPKKHSDRSYASLMVSRWLSFGRVLFSPAHQEISSNPERHVLVIDGLGSEDWSIYCAVTYQQERGYVHDLKERREGRQKASNTYPIETAPANHRRSEVASFNDKFPFPPDFFSAIVIRFPPAMPDSKLKNIIAECRRVLAPGGYLELMVLDLDIANMGVQTRRAIKDLKIKMTAADRSISLKPIIDNVQTVLGSNGFSNLNRCVVGVPVVGKPATSLDSSSESRSSTGSAGLQTRRPSAASTPYGKLGGQANFSLNDLVADHSENADAKIGKMVSRTARSWWQHCFEAGVVAGGGRSKSVFANKDILAECKGRAASFKLLIAYTQKPNYNNPQRRRTMSEPTVPTLATAGSGDDRKQQRQR